MKTKITAIILMSLLVMACNSGKKANQDVENNGNNSEENMDSTTDATQLENTKWVLSVMRGEDMSALQQNGQMIYFKLNPDEKRINGNAGCNTIMGTYDLKDDNRISFSQMATTRMMCPDSKIKESEILNIFNEADSYTISGDKIMIKKYGTTLATFKKSDMNSEPITEKYWKLKTLDGKEVSMAENQERETYFTLKTQDNRVEGFAGCNTINGSYTLEKGNRIKFSHMANTLKACPDVDVNEAEFLKVFELADNYTINDDTLSLNVGKRAPLAVFEAVYFD